MKIIDFHKTIVLICMVLLFSAPLEKKTPKPIRRICPNAKIANCTVHGEHTYFLDTIIVIDRKLTIRDYEKHEYKIPMRDGKKLFTQVYSPKKRLEEYPILITRTPYGIAPYGEDVDQYLDVLGPSNYFIKEGFIFVYQDVRGRYMSEGDFVQMRPIQPQTDDSIVIDESTDLFDTLEWLIKNISNNNGCVGMWGISYPGTYSTMALINAHPALKAVSPQAPPVDWFMGDDWHHNGALFLLQSVNWMRASDYERLNPTNQFEGWHFDYPFQDLYDFFLEIGPIANINNVLFKNHAPFWNYMMKHGNYDDFWKERNYLPYLRNIKPAVMIVGGWYDAENLYGALKTYSTIEKNNPGINNTIVMGPWYHGGWAWWAGNKFLGDISLYSKIAREYYSKNVELSFFNYYLKDKGELNFPEALVFDTGLNTWRTFDQWPPLNIAKQNLYFQASLNLSFNLPVDEEDDSYEEYISDPNKPIPHSPRSINGWSYDFMHDDQRFASRRPDVLVFETDTLKEDITFTGPITVNLYVSTTGTDADWVVKLIDVYPNDLTHEGNNISLSGYQRLIRGDVLRGKFRNSFEKPEPFSPANITEIRFDLTDINHTFIKGHRIMVQVQSSWFPLVDRNPQKFTDIYNADEKDFQKATHRIYHSKKYPSHITINRLIE